MDTLFDLPDTPSPKLRFLREQALTTRELSDGSWRCYLTDETVGAGLTEDEAIIDLCNLTGLKHWNLLP
jgi:hypothetical protein